MSRLIVKNLPAYLTQSRLREHFESKEGPGGTLTDVKIILKPDGTFGRRTCTANRVTLNS